MLPRIATHRGLDPSKSGYFAESSREAFQDQLLRGFGLEFDLRLSQDGVLIVIHDDNLSRISKGRDMRKISDVPAREMLAMDFEGSHLIDLSNLLEMIDKSQSSNALSAIHLKRASQDPAVLDLLLGTLEDKNLQQFIIFDVIPETAHYLKMRNKDLALAPSVAHPYDIERYGVATGNTLISPTEALSLRNFYSWVWLDEWDLTDKDMGVKHLYTEGVFARFHDAGFQIGLVTPELHATSPGLLGGETHPDASNPEALTKAIENIIDLGPDLICTDYPDMVQYLSRQEYR